MGTQQAWGTLLHGLHRHRQKRRISARGASPERGLHPFCTQMKVFPCHHCPSRGTLLSVCLSTQRISTQVPPLLQDSCAGRCNKLIQAGRVPPCKQQAMCIPRQSTASGGHLAQLTRRDNQQQLRAASAELFVESPQPFSTRCTHTYGKPCHHRRERFLLFGDRCVPGKCWSTNRNNHELVKGCERGDRSSSAQWDRREHTGLAAVRTPRSCQLQK